MAGIAGLEPTKRESKSRVLPLHHIPTDFQYITVNLICQDLKLYVSINSNFSAYTVCVGASHLGYAPTPPGVHILFCLGNFIRFFVKPFLKNNHFSTFLTNCRFVIISKNPVFQPFSTFPQSKIPHKAEISTRFSTRCGKLFRHLPFNVEK